MSYGNQNHSNMHTRNCEDKMVEILWWQRPLHHTTQRCEDNKSNAKCRLTSQIDAMPQSERKHTHHEYKPYDKKTMQYATLSHAVDTQKRTKKKNGRDYMLLLWLFQENNHTIKQNKNKLKTNPTRDVNIAHLIVAAKTPVVVVASRTAKLIQDGSHTYHSSGNSESPTICKCTLGASPLLPTSLS